MIHFFVISILLACIAGTVTESHSSELKKRLCQLIKARFIDGNPSGSFESAVDRTLVEAGLDLSPENQVLFWREYQKLQMEWTLGSPIEIGEVFPLCVHDNLNIYHGLHLDVWALTFKLLNLKELEMLESVCKYFHTILKDRMSFCYRYLDEKNDVNVLSSKDIELLRKGISKYVSFNVEMLLRFMDYLSVISPEALTYCTRSDGSMVFLYQHQKGHAASPFALLDSGLLTVNKRFEKYAFFLIKEHILSNIKNAQEFHPTKLPSFCGNRLLREYCSKALCDIADMLIDDACVKAQVIQNFLKECFNYPLMPCNYSPLNPRILVLISKLPEESILENLNTLNGLSISSWKFNNLWTLITGCCRADLINEKMRVLFIKELTGLTINLKYPELPVIVTHFRGKMLNLGTGSKYILDFIPVDLFTKLFNLNQGIHELKYTNLAVSIEKLEEFLHGEGIFHENKVMFEYIKSLHVFAYWPIYINWATYKISKNMINMGDKKAVDLILSILKHISKSSSSEVKRIAREFTEKVSKTYPDLICDERKDLLILTEY